MQPGDIYLDTGANTLDVIFYVTHVEGNYAKGHRMMVSKYDGRVCSPESPEIKDGMYYSVTYTVDNPELVPLYRADQVQEVPPAITADEVKREVYGAMKEEIDNYKRGLDHQYRRMVDEERKRWRDAMGNPAAPSNYAGVQIYKDPDEV